MPTSNPRHLLPVLPVLAVSLIALTLASCGAAGSESVAHIKGSSATITKPMLDHWMRMTVANDFRSNVGTKAPLGLVSEPADYPRCIEAAKKVIPRSYTGKLVLSQSAISLKCHQLYQTIKAQALAYLLSVQWTVLEGDEQGVRISGPELQREFHTLRKSFYKTPANERTYLAERGMVATDVMYQLKGDLLNKRLRPKLEARVAKAGGGQATYVRIVLGRYNGLIARTTCEPGYVVLGCKGYREPAVPLPSASVILEGFAGAVG